MLNIKPCHRCKDRGDVRVEPELAGYGFVVYCDQCSGGEYEVSHGWDREKAIEAWNEAVQERLDEMCDEDGNAPIMKLGKLEAPDPSRLARLWLEVNEGLGRLRRAGEEEVTRMIEEGVGR